MFPAKHGVSGVTESKGTKLHRLKSKSDNLYYGYLHFVKSWDPLFLVFLRTLDSREPLLRFFKKNTIYIYIFIYIYDYIEASRFHHSGNPPKKGVSEW